MATGESDYLAERFCGGFIERHSPLKAFVNHHKIVILGCTGQIGSWLKRLLPDATGLDYPQIDFENPDSLLTLLEDLRPSIIINAAAYTAVDRAETDEIRARTINAVTPGKIAELCKRTNAWLIHYSTDYVYDGSKLESYVESDIVHPLNSYGRTKAEGDHLISKSGCNHIILRMSWVYSLQGQNFLLTMLRLAREKEELKIVSDQIGSPNYARNLAEGTRDILNRLDVNYSAQSGIYHFGSGDFTSWKGFAEAIFESTETHLVRRLQRVLPILTKDYPSKTMRPLNSRLCTSKLERVFGVKLPPWKSQLDTAINDLQNLPMDQDPSL